jgi:carboxyl-terminal processing protease
LYIRNTLNNFIYQYYITHRSALKQFSSVESFYAGFNNNTELWKALRLYAKKDSINLDGVGASDREQVEIRMKALLARFIWRTPGYFYVVNQTDPVLKKAMALLDSNSPMPSAAKAH